MPLPKTSGLQLNTAGLVSSFSLLIKREHLMRSHYEVSIYYRVIAGALGAGEISNFTALLGSWEPSGCELHWGSKRSSEHFWKDLRLLHQGAHRLMSSFLKVLGFQNMLQSDYFDWLFIISITITPTCSSSATALPGPGSNSSSDSPQLWAKNGHRKIKNGFAELCWIGSMEIKTHSEDRSNSQL